MELKKNFLPKLAICWALVILIFGVSWAIIQIYTDVDTNSNWYVVTYYGLQTSLLVFAFGLIIWLFVSIWKSLDDL